MEFIKNEDGTYAIVVDEIGLIMTRLEAENLMFDMMTVMQDDSYDEDNIPPKRMI